MYRKLRAFDCLSASELSKTLSFMHIEALELLKTINNTEDMRT